MSRSDDARVTHLLDRVGIEAERLDEGRRAVRITPQVVPEEIREHLAERYAFDHPTAAADVLDDVCDMLRQWTIHVTHPRYFGLFNPTVRPITVAADAVVALFNPQLAVWAHAPAASEIERHVLGFFARQIGWDAEATTAHFTTGGQEANFTAVVAALADACPSVVADGVRALDAQPVMYLSEVGHQSFHKAAQCAGLGANAVRLVACDEALRMDANALARQFARDRAAGFKPFLVVATAGTTGAGTIDPLEPIAELCESEQVWLHVDAAWAGAVLLSPRHRAALRGIERATSVTWDAHKWLSVPIAAGMFFSRRAVAQSFEVPHMYVPPSEPGRPDAYTSTLQWSRRFTGLKVFMALAELGSDGYAALIDHQVAMGHLLRDLLRERGWAIVNDTPLPLVCFTHPGMAEKDDAVTSVVRAVTAGGRAWVSDIALPHRPRAVRACITSYMTQPSDLAVLLDELDQARVAINTSA